MLVRPLSLSSIFPEWRCYWSFEVRRLCVVGPATTLTMKRCAQSLLARALAVRPSLMRLLITFV
ncbi:TPA: hypothetical protein L6A07_29070 [Pseudomonas aeruginosa]|nr:hypothetical protein CJU35_03920 [Pseudomonas aeruginosa]HBP6379224.1 hypothetical protein [Pseudomonas aeruginosa]